MLHRELYIYIEKEREREEDGGITRDSFGNGGTRKEIMEA